MSKKIVDGLKDANGAFVPKPKEGPSSKEDVAFADIHIDDLLNIGVQVIKRALLDIRIEIGQGSPSRNAIMNLKDIISMLRDLKKDEDDILDNLSDEELQKLKNK